jgi:hypothetical protein
VQDLPVAVATTARADAVRLHIGIIKQIKTNKVKIIVDNDYKSLYHISAL